MISEHNKRLGELLDLHRAENHRHWTASAALWAETTETLRAIKAELEAAVAAPAVTATPSERAAERWGMQ